MTDLPDPVRIEELLVHAGWVRTLALRLVRDESRADDIVQNTWLAALRSPPSDRSRIRAWLARVVTNYAREGYRWERRNEQHEVHAAQPEATASTADLCASADVQRNLIAAVLRLDEPYRSTILLRYFEGLPPRKVAQRLGVKPETVRSRVQRAVAMLREDLRSKEKPGLPWPLALAPLLRRRDLPDPRAWRVVSAARAVLRSSVAWKALAATVLGMVAVGVLGSRLRGTPSRPDLREAAGTRVPTEIASGALRHRAAAGRSAKASVRSDDLTAAAGTEPAPVVPDLVLQGEIAGVEAPGPFRLIVTPLADDPLRTPLPSTTLVAETASFSCALAIPSGPRVVELDVQIDHPAYLPVRARVRVDGANALRLPPMTVTRAAIVSGRVVDEQAQPVANAQVGVFETSGDVPKGEAVDRTVTGADGTFRLRLRDGVPTAVVAAVAGQRPALQRVVGSLGSATELTPLELRAGALVRGTIRDVRGAPVPDGTVGAMVQAQEAMLSLPPHVLAYHGSIDHRSVRARIASDGTFELPGLGPGPYRVTPGALGMTGDLQASLERAALPPARDVDFRVTGGEVRLEVRSGGTPIAGAELRITGGERITPRSTDLHGEVRFLGFPGREYEVGVVAPGFEARTVSVTAPEEGAARAEAIELRALPSTASWTVTLRPPDGRRSRLRDSGSSPPGYRVPWPRHCSRGTSPRPTACSNSQGSRPADIAP